MAEGAGRKEASMERICRNCDFWETGNETAGYCHRNPPLPAAQRFDVVNWVFPMTGALDWCGEFKRRGKGGFK